ncbi:MAG: trimethylamine methyltransferase family protein [Deltaproteobacteria bacterium]|nr:trimethylamine methyltransferase family protein [Deltaproteobacteria bacterium]
MPWLPPGAPVIYGSTSSAMDMKTGGLSIGCPELSMVISATAQMARFYKLPCRSGGGLTDAHIPDGQAGVESTLALVTAVRNGVNFILHAAGILGSYISMSYEKFMLDEEICGIVKKLVSPIEITDEAIDVGTMQAIGIGGQYLTHPQTFKLCRTELYITDLMNRKNQAAWMKDGSKRIETTASDKLQRRLSIYEKPGIDAEIERELAAYVTRRKAEK